MPITFEEVARQVVAAVDSNAGYLLAFQWIKRRYEHVAVRTKFAHLRQIGQLDTPAPITAGTVTATRGSRTVTGDATATAAWGAFVIGRHIRLRVTWYEIGDYRVVGGLGELLLTSAYAEDDLAAGDYRIVQRFLSVAADAAHLGDTFVNPRRRWGLRKRDLSVLDHEAPARSAVSGTAQVVAEVPFDPATGTRRVEVYPYSSTSETYYYIYWRSIGTLQLTDYVSPALPVYGLIEGALVDLFRYKMAQAADVGKTEVAAFWRNEMRTQETKWERFMVEMIAADRGEDDATVLLKHVGHTFAQGDIMTARDHIYAGWTWPN